MTRPPLPTAEYWEWRYASGRDSGAGSYGAEGDYKVGLVNDALREHAIDWLLDLGCGDGHAASHVRVPHYFGYDPSPTAIARCRYLMPDRLFATTPPTGIFDATLSLDVLYHLVDDAAYLAYMDLLFGRAHRLVIVYGTNEEGGGPAHVRHRLWLPDVPPRWRVVREYAGIFKHAWIFTPET